MKMVRRRPTRRMQGDNERGFLRKRAQEALRAAERAVAIRERLTKQNPVPLLSLPVSYRALHQHRAGACLGNLTVTAEAVDYRSDDGKDVFHIPIHDIRSVARSMGSLPDALWTIPADFTGCRLEAPGRSYGFFAVEGEFKSANEVKLQDTAKKTKELFEIVYRLWQDSVSAAKAPTAK